MRRLIVSVASICMLVAGASSALANIAMPRETWTEISMVSEHVKIVLSPGKVTVEASFELKNAGDAVTAVVGYPRGMLEKSLDDFTVTIDGEAAELTSQSAGEGAALAAPADADKPVRKRYQFEGDYPEWKVFNVRFDAGETRKVVVRYHVAPAEVKAAEGGTLLAYIYTLRTGATWKGNIEKALVEMTLDGLSPADLVTVTPKKREQDGTRLTWTFEDFKPTQDIEVTFRAPEAKDKRVARSVP
jgi:hypothetical protein